MVMFRFLHPLNHFFGLDTISKDIQQIDDFHIFVSSLFQRILNPVIRFAAHIYKKIAIRNFKYVICGGLVAMKIDAII